MFLSPNGCTFEGIGGNALENHKFLRYSSSMRGEIGDISLIPSSGADGQSYEKILQHVLIRWSSEWWNQEGIPSSLFDTDRHKSGLELRSHEPGHCSYSSHPQCPTCGVSPLLILPWYDTVNIGVSKYRVDAEYRSTWVPP